MNDEQFSTLCEKLDRITKVLNSINSVLIEFRGQSEMAEEMGRMMAHITVGGTPVDTEKDADERADLIDQILSSGGLGHEPDETQEEYYHLESERQVQIVTEGLLELSLEELEDYLRRIQD